MRTITQFGFKAALSALAFAFLFIFGCTPKEEPIVDIAVASVSLSPGSLELEEGQTATITATVNPSNATHKTVSWSSSNSSVATVSGGKVTAVAAGSATITATAGGKSATCTVTVKKKVIAVTGIALDPTSVTITVGETASLTATVSPADATDKTVTWSSSDAKIATVKDGTVTAVAAGTATITAKAGDKSATCEVTVKAKEVPVTGIALEPTSVTITVGETASLTATVSPADATDKTVTWSSSRSAVATVKDGTVTAVAAGTATITAKAGDKTATCTVIVKAKVVPVTGITLDPTSVTIVEGETATLTATVSPADATDKTVTWSSSDTKVATVKDGTVTAIAVGTATITAKAGDKTATCKVTVTPIEFPVTDITLRPTSLTLEEGHTATLTAIITPSNATDKTVTWSSSNESVATVKDGTVTAVAAGTATITAKAGDKSATCPVTVTPKVVPVTGVTLDPTSVTLEIGKTAVLTATVSPADATDKTVMWTTSDNEVATVQDGTVTAIAVGTALITAAAGGKVATCKVTVTPKVIPVTGITLDPTSVTIVEGETATLTATVSPADATDKTVTWTSSRSAVATVKDGTVTAVAAGTATITAKAGDKTATCTVIVKAKVVPVTGITLDPTSVTITVDETASLTATVSPADATDKTVTWFSSNESVATVDNGTVTAVAVGTATITAKAGEQSATCEVTVIPNPEMNIKTALMKIYDALDGPHWNMTRKWDLSKPLNSWDCVRWDPNTGELELESLDGVGMKGQLPDCFDELTALKSILIQNEPGLTGTLPPSFAKLKNLTYLGLILTSMTSMPDIFSGMPLQKVFLSQNNSMTGPLPESLGSSPALVELNIQDNRFTGKVPDSWAQLGTKLIFRLEGCLDPRVPDSFVNAPDADYLINMYLTLASSELSTAPIEVGDYDIPAYLTKRSIKDLVTGQSIPFRQIVSKNKATVLLSWGTWCPFSKELMPVLKRMYEKYHKDGLEIIAEMNATSAEVNGNKLKDIILEKGYDQWYNFNMYDLWTIEDDIWSEATPSAIIVDKNGTILYSSRTNISDPARNRFGYIASGSLIPLLENIFGPLEGDDDYESTDYSQDGQVITIQQATVGKGINLVFMGDAYTDKDIASGLYEQLMRAAADEFFSIEPYQSFRNRFNVYAVKVVSKHGKTGTGYTTALGAKMVNGAATTGNREKVYEYALKVPGISSKNNLVVGVLVNSIYHGGIADLNETYQAGIGYVSSIGNDRYTFGATMRHETGGHAFAFLADEYATQNGSPTQAIINEYNRLYNTYGWYSNIDFTNDPTKVRWRDFLSDSRYKDEVGIYEGAVNVTKGAYRPSANSMMNQDMEYYNAPSRWAIYKRIMELSGETASFSKFLEYDAVNRGQQHNAPRRARSNYVEWVPDSAPVVTR